MRSFIVLLIAASLASAQGPVQRVYTVSSLPTASTQTGQILRVSDAANSKDCTAGGGAYVVDCRSNGTVYAWAGGNTLPDPGSNGILSRSAANTTVARTIQPTSGGDLTWTNPDGVSGNPTPALILPSKQYYRAAICQGVNAYPGFSTPATGAPTATCSTGTNTNFGELDFAVSQTVQDHFRLPVDWTGAIDVEFVYRSAGTTGNVVWNAAAACVADGATEDPAFNTAQTVSTAALGVTLTQKTAALTGLTTTGCAGGNEFHFKIGLDSSTTASGVALIGLRLTVRRAL